MKDLLSIISIAGFICVSILCLLAAKFGNEWAAKMMDTILPMVIQCWIINFTQLIQYYYGTSASSQAKNETIKKIALAKEGIDECIELTDEVKKP